MSASQRVGAGLIVGALLAAGWGCGVKPSVTTTDDEATVTGSVTIKGKKATAGSVSFNPSNYKRQVAARTASIAKDGTYSIKTLVGENQIKVSSPGLGRSRELSDVDLYFDVKAGPNTYDIVLPPG